MNFTWHGLSTCNFTAFLMNETDTSSRIYLGKSGLGLLAYIAQHDVGRNSHMQFGDVVSLSKPWHLI